MYFPIISILAWLIVGSTCGWLETERRGDKVPKLATNIIIGVVGAFLGGWFFFVWGDLVPGDPYLSPLISGLIGSGVSLSVFGFFADWFGRLYKPAS